MGRNAYSGSRIRILIFNPSRIPDPGRKDSGFATVAKIKIRSNKKLYIYIYPAQVCLPIVAAENWKPATKTDQVTFCCRFFLPAVLVANFCVSFRVSVRNSANPPYVALCVNLKRFSDWNTIGISLQCQMEWFTRMLRYLRTAVLCRILPCKGHCYGLESGELCMLTGFRIRIRIQIRIRMDPH
jgi:hypothetical protein